MFTSAAGAALLLVGSLVAALAVYEVLARVGERRGTVIAALTIAVLATAPRVLGAPFHSLALGLVALVLLCAAPAFLGARRMLRSGVVDVPADVAFVGVASVVFLLGAWVEIGARLWDGDFGHYGFSSGIARGVLPPEHPLFPGEPLRYHVGFDVLVALLVALPRLPVGAAVHVVSLALLALVVFAARDVGRALAPQAPLAGALAAALALLGYGPGSACLAGGWAAGAPFAGVVSSCSALFPKEWVSAQSMPPSVFSSFFQHPQGLAMPIALALLLLALDTPSRARTLVCAVGLVLLAHCQIAFFACAGLAIGAALVLHPLAQRRPVDALLHALPLLAAGAVGFLSSDIAGGAGELRFGRGYFADGPALLAVHYVALFGPTIIAVPLALALARVRPLTPLRTGLVIAALAGFVVASTFTYARSWDIVKFFAVASFFANLLLADLLASLAVRRRALAVGLALVCAMSATFWAVRSGVLNGVIAPHYALPPPSALGAALLRAAGDRIGARDVVLTARVDIWHQGFHVAGADHKRFAKGQLIDTVRAEERTRIARRALRTLAAVDLDALSVDWVLVPASHPMDDARFVREADVLDHTLYRVAALGAQP